MAWSDGDLPGVLEAGASRVDRSGSNVILCSPEGAVVMPNNQTRRPSTNALRLKLVPHVLTCAAWPLQTQSGNIARQQRKNARSVMVRRLLAVARNEVRVLEMNACKRGMLRVDARVDNPDLDAPRTGRELRLPIDGTDAEATFWRTRAPRAPLHVDAR